MRLDRLCKVMCQPGMQAKRPAAGFPPTASARLILRWLQGALPIRRQTAGRAVNSGRWAENEGEVMAELARYGKSPDPSCQDSVDGVVYWGVSSMDMLCGGIGKMVRGVDAVPAEAIHRPVWLTDWLIRNRLCCICTILFFKVLYRPMSRKRGHKSSFLSQIRRNRIRTGYKLLAKQVSGRFQ